jgi:hypothetical protein
MWEYGTILREPVSYVRSMYRSALVPKQHGSNVGYTSIRDWYSDAKAVVESGCNSNTPLHKAEIRYSVATRQFPIFRFLADSDKWIIGCPGDEDALVRARARVEGMQWVGIMERFEDSVCLFLTTRNKVVDEGFKMTISHKRGADRPKKIDQIYGPDPPSDDEWTELLGMEIDLYKFGLSIFSARVTTLHQEFEAARVNAGSARPVIRTILAQKEGSFMREQCAGIISGESSLN